MKIFSPVLKGTTTTTGTSILSGSFTGSLQGTAATASYVVSSQQDPTQDTRLSTIESRTGSFATTASNAFNGSQTITGSLTATGTIVAQTLVVQTITSSVEYVSGSNRFGSTTGNTHEFTGSVLVSGSVGIGTSSPQSRLHTYAINDRAAIRIQNTAANKVWELLPAINGVSNAGLSIFNVTDSTTPLYITDGGNIGIGSTNPLSKLDVSTSSTEAICVGNSSNTISSGDLIGAISFVSRDGSTYSSGGVANIRSYASSTYNTGNVAADLRFYVSNGLQNTTAAAIFGTEAMRITNEGKVGIGTTSPLRTLHVYSDNANGIGIGKNLTSDNISSNLYFYPSALSSDKRNWGITTYFDRPELLQFRRSSTITGDPYDSGVTVMTLDGINDRVGIGTISPISKLQVTS